MSPAPAAPARIAVIRADTSCTAHSKDGRLKTNQAKKAKGAGKK